MATTALTRRRRFAFTLALLLAYRIEAGASKTNEEKENGACISIRDGEDEPFVCEEVVEEDVSLASFPRSILNKESFTSGGASVVIVATVDGMLAGLSLTTGEMLWSHPPNPPRPHSYRMHNPSSTTTLLDPWVSTSSSKSSSKSLSSSTFAIPSIIDGKVYITTTVNDDIAEQIDAEIPQLVAQSPFTDGHTFFTGTKETSVTHLDALTGEWEPNNTNKNVVWLGRADYHVTMQQQSPGSTVQFSYAEWQSVHDMVLRKEDGTELVGDDDDHLLADDHDSQLTMVDASTQEQRQTPTPPVVKNIGCIWATPGGLIAFVPPFDDDDDDRNPGIAWVAQLPSPVTAALDATDGGRRLPIYMVPDAKIPSVDPFASLTEEDRFARTTVVVGSLKPSGQLFAMPLRDPVVHRTTTAALLSSLPSSSNSKKEGASGSGAVLASSCEPGSALFPKCLTKAVLSGSTSASESIPGEGGVVPFFHDFNTFDVYHRSSTPPAPPAQRSIPRPPRKINTGHLYQVLITLLAAFFELGRRIRDHKAARSRPSVAQQPTPTTTTTTVEATPTMMIQVKDDIILGHGGGGTVVLEGMLDGRRVAVKRMLKTYHASADREISLLIESDGHPNVVRYFLKELRGDFVYLALELCDVSLHDLIGHMCGKVSSTERATATRNVLYQIVQGVTHLHRLRIVHRDLKPANILLAASKKRKAEDACYDVFQRGDYVAKISDMGLGKQLVGHSSYGGSLMNKSSLQASRSEGHSSVAGVGAGSVGWQAPEVMAMRHHSSDASVKSEGSNADPISDLSPIDISPHARTSRSVDIFSLGCIFYSTLVPGSHPFGEWYEREANIMHNRPNLDQLQTAAPDAYDLVKRMLSRTPSSRPTSQQVGQHPYFWSSDRRLAFLCDFSDRLENDFANCAEVGDTKASARLFLIERDAAEVIGISWDKCLDKSLVNNVQKWRSYDSSAIRDLLRLIRNKYHHFDELPDELKTRVASKAGLMEYFEERFPILVIHCYDVCGALYGLGDAISEKYSIRPLQPKNAQAGKDSASRVHARVADTDRLGEQTKPTPSEAPLLDLPAVAEEPTWISTDVDQTPAEQEAIDQLIVWHGSTAANTLNCRGWNRGDDEWARSGSDGFSKKSRDLIRNSENARYRTRLCNHWDLSLGTFCPMQKKGKCIFAHGPAELRVKEGKRTRWGRLVDTEGNCSNPKASGGEDTYGAARAIEAERSAQGKWNTDKKTTKRKPQTAPNRRPPSVHQSRTAKQVSVAAGLS